MRSCYGKGKSIGEQENLLYGLFNQCKEEQRLRGGSILSHFTSTILSDYEKAVYGWVRLVVLRNFPVRSVSHAEIRKWFSVDVFVSVDVIPSTIFNLVEIVESKIAQEMQNTIGAIPFDGWTVNLVHYTGVYASFCRRVTVRQKKALKTVHEPVLRMLVLAPLGQMCDEEDECSEATTFNADAHVKFFRDFMPF